MCGYIVTLDSIPDWVIPKTQTVVLDASLLNTQHYKIHIKGKVEQSKESSSALPLPQGIVAIKMGAFCWRSTTVANFTNIYNKIQPWMTYKDWYAIKHKPTSQPSKGNSLMEILRLGTSSWAKRVFGKWPHKTRIWFLCLIAYQPSWII